MSTLVRTANSVYEIDGGRIRRVEGMNDPTPNQRGGGWLDADVSMVRVAGARRLLIRYGHGDTLTSPIVDIQGELLGGEFE